MKGCILLFPLLYLTVLCESRFIESKLTSSRHRLHRDGFKPYIVRPRYGGAGKRTAADDEDNEDAEILRKYHELRRSTNEDVQKRKIIIIEKASDDGATYQPTRQVEDNGKQHYRYGYILRQFGGGKRDAAGKETPRPERFGKEVSESLKHDPPRWGRFGKEVAEEDATPPWGRYGDGTETRESKPRWGRFGGKDTNEEVRSDPNWQRFGREVKVIFVDRTDDQGDE